MTINGLSANYVASLIFPPVAPLVLDLNGDDGKLEQTGWVSAQDGLVVVDRNGNGMIDDMSEILSEYYGGQAGTGGNGGTKPYKNGFEALKSLDHNIDGVFNDSDAA